jgi:hypothetical protein
MDKKILAEIIDDVFRPLAFKRKGINWRCENDDVVKIVTLEKSNFGNLFSISYGITIKAIPLDVFSMHVFESIPEISNIIDLRRQLAGEVKSYLTSINTEKDLLDALKKMPHLNSVPLVVKRHFGLES